MGDSCLIREFDLKDINVIVDDKLREKSIDARKYTISFLKEDTTINISDEYKVDYVKDNTFILGEILKKDEMYKLVVNVYFKNFDEIITGLIYKETKTNIHKILSNIINSDKDFFLSHQSLLSIPVYVSFNSSYTVFNHIHLCGYIDDFMKIS